MAAAQESIEVDCQICMLRFTIEARHRPRSLPCGHSLCHDCLDRHISQTITGTTFQCPFCRIAIQVRHTSQERQDSLAEQFPVNFVLAETIEHIEHIQIQNTTAQLKTDFDELKRMCQTAEYKMDNEHYRYLSKLDLSVAQTTADINNAADKLIQEFTAAIRGNQEEMLNRLGVDHESARGRIEEAGKKTKTLLSEPQNYLKCNEKLLTSESLTKSQIKLKENIEQIKQLQKMLNDYLATPTFGIQHRQITFTKHVNTTDSFATNIGTINVSDEQTDLSLGVESNDEQTVPKVIGTNPISDKLKLVKVINTKGETSPDLSSIDVLNIQDSVKIVVVDNANSCIKCYNYDDGTLYGVFKTTCQPRGLTKLGNGNHVVVTIPTNRQIIFVKVDSIITATKTVDTEKAYSRITQLRAFGLAVSVWASDTSCVDILDLNGHVIRSISDLPPGPRYLTSMDDSLLVISYTCTCDAFTCVTLSLSSSHIDWVKSRDSMMLKDARGITCDGHGFVYVTDFERHAVVQISADGDVIRDIVTKQDGLVNPRAVCFVRDCLYMTQENGQIKIFTWT